MEEIKYRGQRFKNNEWVYGFIVISRERPGRTAYFIIVDQECNEPWKYYSIIPKTLGRYTGKRDKNKKEIYEFDILLIDGNRHVMVYWNDSIGGWDTKYIAEFKREENFIGLEYTDWNIRTEVVGDKFKNKELLKTGETNE
jgi:uncharacterized phage protein (TIGR01671 family)